jgi:hypothetical protein
MIDFLLTPDLIPFTIALAAFGVFAVIETVGLLLGLGISEFVDNLFPDAELDVDTPDGCLALGWLHVGAVPVLILVMLFLSSFALVGMGTQAVALESLGRTLPWWMAAVPALAGSIFAVRVFGGLARRFVIKDETTAVSSESFLGSSAQIVLGATERGKPTQAKLTDPHGQTHYILVEPLREGVRYGAGETVVLVQRDGAKFFVVDDDVESLLALGDDSRFGVPELAAAPDLEAEGRPNLER